MDKTTEKFIEKIKKQMHSTCIKYGKDFYNFMKDKYIESTDSYITLLTFKEATNLFFEKNFTNEEAKELQDIVNTDIDKINKKKIKIYKLKHKIGKAFVRKLWHLLYWAENSKNQMNEDKSKYFQYKRLVEFLEGNNKIYVDFNRLTDYFEELDISVLDSFEFILSIVKLNIMNFNEEIVTPDYEKIRSHEFKYLSSSQVNRLIEQKNVEDFISADSKKHQKARVELREFIKQNPLDISYIIESCNIIDKNYIQISNLTEENIISIYKALVELRIDPNYCRKIAAGLYKKCSKLKKENQTKQKNIVSKPKKDIKPMMSKKEINLITKELKRYFDFENMLAIKPLSLDEIIYCVALLTKISADQKTIDRFLFLVGKLNKKENPIYLYANLYNKLLAYKDKYDIENIIVEIEQELQMMFICSQDEYQQIKISVEDKMKSIFNILGNDYEYEKQQAKIKKFTYDNKEM